MIIIYFIYVVVYTAIFSFAGYFYYTQPQKSVYRKFCVLIPCYKGDNVIIEVARKALEQSYNSDYYSIVVIADSLQEKTLLALQQLPIQVIKVQFESSTKVKSLNTALTQLKEDFDYAIILDTDNIMASDFILRMNETLSPTIKAVQGQRKPKNSDNSLAVLDGISEAINNHIYRQGTVALGLSSSISGSGVAFEYSTLKNKISSMNSVGGFDRELELLLLADGIKVHYQKSAIVFDEKVSQSDVFQNQRRRWISSQYFYLRKYFGSGMKALFKGDLAYFNSSVLRNIQLPRLINLGLLSLMTFSFYFFKSSLNFGYSIWPFLFVINCFSILIAIPSEFYNKKLFLALFQLPTIFTRMIALLFKLNGANKKFIHTPHGMNPNNSN